MGVVTSKALVVSQNWEISREKRNATKALASEEHNCGGPPGATLTKSPG
jgi:hypothetical protein